MREIKVRAWDGKTMFKPFSIDWFKAGSATPEGWNTAGVDSGLWNANVIFLEFTDLKDKNGREIYEGDILRCESNIIRLSTDEPTGEKRIEYYEVVFFEAMFTTKEIKNGHINPFAPSPSIWEKYYEIIGNIYENPELLEVKG